jgi:hypothetical protein
MEKTVVEETSKQVGTFFDIMRAQPLSLALVVMNFTLMAFLFYSATARRETVQMVLAWQERTDKLMASCVSSEIMNMVLQALDRDRFGQSGRKPAEQEPTKQ